MRFNRILVMGFVRFCEIDNGQVNGLPFNKYSWLVTHNSFSIVDAPSLTGVQRITFYNQEDTVTNQLKVCDYFLFFSPFLFMYSLLIFKKIYISVLFRME